ncbi:MAG: hypothetical protein JKX84_00360 [Flavobacteriales bacterium]|nr:hypothetical protein [Flavobacteriales bacterium]
MKSIAITMMFLFVGVTASMAQDKAATASTDATVETTTTVSSEAKDACPPGCTMPCCADKAVSKKACSSAQKKACCAKGSASAAKKAECAAHAKAEAAPKE